MDKLAAFYLVVCLVCTAVAGYRRSWSALGAGGMLLVTWVLTNTYIHWMDYESRAEANVMMDSVCFLVCGFLLIHGWRPWRAALSGIFFLQLVSHLASAIGDGRDTIEYVCVVIRNGGFFLECFCLLFSPRIVEFDPRRDPIEQGAVVPEVLGA